MQRLEPAYVCSTSQIVYLMSSGSSSLHGVKGIRDIDNVTADGEWRANILVAIPRQGKLNI